MWIQNSYFKNQETIKNIIIHTENSLNWTKLIITAEEISYLGKKKGTQEDLILPNDSAI